MLSPSVVFTQFEICAFSSSAGGSQVDDLQPARDVTRLFLFTREAGGRFPAGLYLPIKVPLKGHRYIA